MDILVSVVGKVAEYTVAPIGRKIGYFLFYKGNLKELVDHVKELEGAKERMNHRVEEERRNGREIERDVENWLDVVDKVIETANQYQNDPGHAKVGFSGWLFPNCVSRHQLSRKATKLTKEIVVQLQRYGKFDERVGYRTALDVAAFSSPTDGKKLETREELKEGIVKALKDSTARIIGVCGLGGVGKTTLVKELGAIAKQEKLFDVVVIAHVSELPDIRNIQGEIADILHLRFEEETTAGRAYRLKQRIKAEKSILIILDDIWTRLDLEKVGIPSGDESIGCTRLDFKKVGIPSGDESNGCKLLVTSRNEHVLLEMQPQKDFIFKLELLNENEAWGLFQSMVGDDVVNDISLRDVATKVAQQCGGLPLGIVTIARTFRNKDVYNWEDALRQLQSVGHADIDHMIEFSYNRLDSEEMKALFLLLAVMKENAQYYLKLAIGLNIFKGINTVREARNRFHMIIGSLKSYCLLLDESEENIQMHDIVRKVAIFIAYREKHVFVLKQWPTNGFMTNCTQIILDWCHIHELPPRLDCPNIELFFLASENHSLEIPNTFFEGMGSLKVLDLTHLNLSLPTSFQSLTSLQTLCLEGCVLENMEVIGALKNLEILSLVKSSMNKLPSEIATLGQLRMLDLSDSRIEIIPPNIISCLTKLEELKMGNSSINWKVGNSLEQNVNASLAELRKLSNLTSLELQVREAWVLPRDVQLVFEKLTRYKIAIGDVWEWSQIKNGTLNTLLLKIPSNIHLEHGIKALIKGVESLYLDEVDGIENVLYQLNAEGFPLLKKLHIQNNVNLKHVVDTVNRNQVQASFIKLERLVLKNLRNLEQICRGPLATNSFCKLGVIQVKNCDQLKYLLSISMLKELSQLSEIEVSQCHSMKGIMLRDSNSSAANNTTNELNEFLSLRSLTLEHLSTLDNFFSDDMMPTVTERKNQGSNSCVSIPFFSVQVVFPKLDALRLRSLNMNKIWNENQLSMNNLTSLIVENCGGLKYLLTSTMVESFKSLKRLEIRKCHLMVEIITKEERTNGTIALKEVHFSKLETIILNDMKNLKTIWHCHFDTVKTLQVANCDKIEVIFPSSGQQTFHNLEKLEVKDCALVKEIFELTSGENSSIEDTMHLKEITLQRLPKLKKIWSMDPQGILCYPNLENVQIDECEILEYLFPYSVVTCCSHLKELCIKNCQNMKVIVAEKRESTCTTPIFQFHQLSTLLLWNLNKLKGFYAGNHILEFSSSLRNIDTGGCAKMNLFKTSSTSNLERFGGHKFRVSIQEAPFIIEEVIPNLEMLRLSNRDAEMILQAQNLDTLFPKIKFIGLNCYKSEEATFPYWLLQNMPALETMNVERSSFKKIFQDERVVVSQKKIHTRLKKLDLFQLPKLEHICEEGYQIDPIIEFLEYLWVEHCPSLKNLLPSSATFNHLILLEITNCNGMICLISSSTARDLVNLTKMTVKDCDSLEEIIKGEENVDIIAFTSLQTLKLECLPRLNKFCSSKCVLKFPLLAEVAVKECPRMKIFSEGNTSAPNLRKVKIEADYEKWRWNGNLNDTLKNMFEDKVAFYELKSLSLSEYPELKDLWYGQLQNNVFCNLKSLVVERCDFLSDVLFPSHLLQVLLGLEEVEVRDCDSLEALFDVKGMKSEEIEVKHSSHLKRLTLSGLPKLKQIWNEDPHEIFSFVNLCTVDVSMCQSLLYIFPLSICQDLGQLEVLDIESCGVEEIVAAAMEEEGSIMKCSFKFPQLKVFQLIRLINLKNFYPGKHTLECPSLENLNVYLCEALRLFSFNSIDFQQVDQVGEIQQAMFSIAKLSQNLEEVVLNGSDVLRILNGCFQENILHQVKFLHLQCFHETPTNFLKHFHAIFPNLVIIEMRISSLETLFPTKGYTSMQISKQIRYLVLFEMEKLEYIWEEDFPLDDPFLQQLECLSLHNCPSLMSLVPTLTSFTNLEELEVVNCKKLVYLITSSTAKSLVQLTSLIIEDCEMILDVVKTDKQGAEEEDIIFQNLEYLRFVSMSSLRSFYYGKHTFMFPSLTYVRVEECPQMKIFSSGLTVAPYLTEVQVEKERMHWKGDLNTTIEQLFMEKEVSHPDDK